MKTRRFNVMPKVIALMLMVLLAGAGKVAAQSAKDNQGLSSAGGGAPTTRQGATPHYVLELANRRIFEFRADLEDYTPEERLVAAKAKLHSVLAHAQTVLVTTQAIPAGIQICLDGKPLFVVTPGDIQPLEGETMDSAADKAKQELGKAILEATTLATPEQMLKALGEAGLLTASLAVLIWLIRKIRMWLQVRITRMAAAKTESVKSRELRRAGLKSFVAVLRTVFNVGTWLLGAFVAYVWLIQVLRCFPYLRPTGEFLNKQIVMAGMSFGHGLLLSLPGLVVIALIIMVAKLLSRIVANLFEAVEDGDVTTTWLDIHTAATTRRIVVFMIWVGAVVVAYPYIPGSDSLAFKGVTVFAGLVFSLGSTNLVNQIASGLILVYSRAFRTGDYVRFGEIEGTVIRVGVCSTYIRTIQNEEMHIANAVLVSGACKNYSRLADKEGLFLTAKATISYSTPWRQVQAMLLEAARRTPGLLAEPKAFVLQTALADFYVEYELNVRLARPDQRQFVLAQLHANILDIFNEHGVQILSPHYLTDPSRPHVVPQSNWYLAPAQPEDKKA